MKNYLVALLGIFGLSTPSSAMIVDSLDEPFEHGHQYKDLTAKNDDPRAHDDRYKGRSNLSYFLTNYPKMPMVHSYNHVPVYSPFSAAFPKARAPKHLENIHSQHLPNHQKIYSFVVQTIEKRELGVIPHYSLKPQYLMHPDLPTHFDGRAPNQAVRWMAMPGGVGSVEPELGNSQATVLHADAVSSHAIGPNDYGLPEDYMILSGDSLHLRGINPDESVDFTSLVAYEDEGKKIAAFTYHWLLNERDLDRFVQAANQANTFKQLITNLHNFFPESFDNLLTELVQYIGLAPRIEKIEPNLRPTAHVVRREKLSEQLTITTDNNANASYQAESNRFPVTPGKRIRVPYDITVEKGGIMSLGLLNSVRGGWYGEEIVLKEGHYTDFFERIVPENETTASLVLRNYHLGTPGQTTFRVNSVEIEKEVDENPVTVHLNPTAHPVFVSRPAGLMKITTDNNADATYQLESNRIPVTEGDKIRIPYDITVEKDGIMSLGLLNSSRNGWYGDEVVLNEGRYEGVLERIVPQNETETSLVLRNYHLISNGGPGQTTFTVNRIKIEKEEKSK